MTDLEKLTRRVDTNRFSSALSVSTNLLRMKEVGDALRDAETILTTKEFEDWKESLNMEDGLMEGYKKLSKYWKLAEAYIEQEDQIILVGIIVTIDNHLQLMKKRRKK